MANRPESKRRFYNVALDPNYQAGMSSEKTRRTWEQMYLNCLQEEQCATHSENAHTDNLNMDILDSDNKEDDLSEDSDDGDLDEPFQTFSIEEPTCSDDAHLENSTDASRSCSIDDGKRIMFEKSKQTVNDVVEIIVAYTLRFGDSLEARKSLIEMFKICAGPDFANLNLSNYKLAQVFDPPSEKIKFHFYCKQCMKKVLFSSEKKGIKGQSVLCDICETNHSITLSNVENFVTVDLEYQLRTLLENDDIAEYFNPESDKFIVPEKNTKVMKDVHDSLLHREATKHHHTRITYIVSTDGAPLFHITKRGFWPLQILLNNLPWKIRFKFILLVGIMILKTEPKADLMNLFIDEFWKQASRLHYKGLKVKFKNMNTETTIYFTPIFAVADSIARAILENRLQFNGFYGCSYCYHLGVHLLKMGIKYPFLDKPADLRTHESHMQDMAEALKKGSFVRGVKGESSFTKIENFDMVWGFPLEYMHNGVLGVTQQVWNNFYTLLTPAQRKTIDDYLVLIQPPRDLRRCTIKISNKSIWKATHWKSWLLYFCIPLCSTFIPSENLEHFALFVNSMFTLLKMNISEEELDTCEQDLLMFVGQYEMLYGVERMTFNIHILLHFVESIRQSGPPWATSAFPFEGNIHFLKETLNGPKSVEQQMSKKSLSILQYRLRPPTGDISRKAEDFITEIFISKKCTKSAVTVQNVTFFGPNPKNVFSFTINKEFERCIYNNCVYSSNKYTRSKKFDDTLIKLKSGEFVQIIGIYLLPNNACSFEVRKLIVKPFIVGKVALKHIWEVTQNVPHLAISLAEVHSKAVIIDLKIKQYICDIPNTIEAQ